MLRVLSPVAGHSLAVSDVPDPVFAKGLVGPGSAIRPLPGRQAAVAPVSGTLTKLHPHAFLILHETGHGVLVHLGIDTCHMQGEGFGVLAHEGDHVETGEEIVSWNPDLVEQSGRSPICAVVVLDCDPAHLLSKSADVDVVRGDLLFEVLC